MLTLALEGSAPSLYIAIKGDNLLIERSIDNINHQDGLLLSKIDELLKDANASIGDVSLLVLGEGPGSFTSLRIASSLFKGFSLAEGIPIRSVSTLDALSLSFDAVLPKDTIVVPLIDARMKRFYTAFYQNGKRLTEDMDISFDEILKRLSYDRIALVLHKDEYARIKAMLPENLEGDEKRIVLLPQNLLFNPCLSMFDLAKDKPNDLDGKGPRYVREHSGLL